MKRAKFLGETDQFGGYGRLYELSPPHQIGKTFFRRKPIFTSKIVIVQFTHYFIGGGPKTFIYPLDQNKTLKFGDRLDESVFNAWDYQQALKNMGYKEVSYE